MKVLIIEDDIQLNRALSEFFMLKVFQTLSAKDGLEAIQKIDTHRFDLYVIDINIPEISGLELVKHIRKIDLHTPIIIITASLEIENFSNAFEYGCSEYIKKPFHLKELDIRVNNLLSIFKINTITLTDEFIYDFHTEEFFYKDIPIRLRYKEKRFCTLMLKNINTYVSTEVIHDYVWEGDIKETYPLRQLVAELRKKLPLNILHSKVKVGYIITLE